MHRGAAVLARPKPLQPCRPPSFDELKEAYLRHLTLRNCSPLGIRQTEQAIRFFVEFLAEKGITSIDKVGRETVELYKAHLAAYQSPRKAAPLSSSTIRGRLFTIIRWLKYLRKAGVISRAIILDDIQAPPRVRRLPRGVMSRTEIARVMAQPNLRTLLGYRDRTIMEMLYSTGMRAAELIGLELQDVDLEKCVVRIRHGKGGKERLAIISTPCLRFIERYLKVVRPELMQGMRPCGHNWLKKYQTGGSFLFLSVYGGTFSGPWLGALMKGYIRKAGIDRPISPVHGFRHSIATHLMEGGMDVRYVQAFLGHSSIDSTQIYTHVERGTLKKLFRRFHPRENVEEEFKPFQEGAR